MLELRSRVERLWLSEVQDGFEVDNLQHHIHEGTSLVRNVSVLRHSQWGWKHMLTSLSVPDLPARSQPRLAAVFQQIPVPRVLEVTILVPRYVGDG